METQGLNADPMMTHLMRALDSGQDIGHYGRLVFVMIARHYMQEEEIISWLTKDPDCDERKARGLVKQVNSRDYNPPKRERILEWMQKQQFPICPNPDDPSACNVYRNMEFPERIYDNIAEFHEEKA